MRLSRILTLVFLVCLFALILLACKGNVADENRSPGEVTFRNRCQTCHSLPKPTKMADAEWPPFVKGHAEKAKLSDEQIDQLLAYLISSN